MLDTKRSIVLGQMDRTIKAADCYLTALSQLKPGRLYSHSEMGAIFQKKGLTPTAMENYLKRLALVPWLTIRQTESGFIFAVDAVLKEMCESKSGG